MVVLLVCMGVVVALQVVRKKAPQPPAQTETMAPGAASGSAPVSASEVTGHIGTGPAQGDATHSGETKPLVPSGLPQPEPVVGAGVTDTAAAAPDSGTTPPPLPESGFALQPPGASTEKILPSTSLAATAQNAGVKTSEPMTVAAKTAAPAKPAAAPAAQKAEPAAKAATKTDAKAPAAATSNRLDKATVTPGKDAVVVRLHAVAAFGEVKHFPLKAPKRLVVDLMGDWKTSSDPKTPSNRLVKNVRMGRHADKMRIVMDLTDAAAATATVEKAGPNEVVVTVR